VTAQYLTDPPPTQVAGSQWRDRAGFPPASWHHHVSATVRARPRPGQ